MIALEAGIPQAGLSVPVPEFKTFAEAVKRTLELLSATVKEQRIAAREFPDLRAAYASLTEKRVAPNDHNGFIFIEADRMTNSLNTLHEQISVWRQAGAATKRPTNLNLDK